jgi:DNA-binding response OmpR family regulator
VSARILLVEDSETLAEDLRLFLPKRFHMDWVAGSEQAIAHLARAGPPDLVILDLCLAPHLSPCKEEEGFALLGALRQRLAPKVPVIVLSAHDAGEVAPACLELGAAAFLSKPCVIAELVDQVEDQLGSRA